ncbi:hypothetical protein SDC9_140225 [bioreactor metagenome]|uniref:Uncharacterized protein n=1 Tax=bioreactor metagenome TaxID=1076179 RepID=A0A645DUW8_9ZZZZ
MLKICTIDDHIGRIRYATRGEPLKVGIKDHQHQQTKHKGREGCAHNTKDTGCLINPPIMVDRSLNAQPNTNRQNREDCPNGEVKRIRKPFCDQLDHRFRGSAGITKIAKENAAAAFAGDGIYMTP